MAKLRANDANHCFAFQKTWKGVSTRGKTQRPCHSDLADHCGFLIVVQNVAFYIASKFFLKTSLMGCTPAVALKLAGETWTIEKLIEEAAKDAN